jgi:hypothetical protein
MRAQWEKMLQRVQEETPRIQTQAQGAGQRIEQRAQEIKDEAQAARRP